MNERPMRVTYREGQRLHADDLTAEQEYLIALERRHNLGQHAPGVVSGLARGTDPAGIEPGVAVNAEGRLLVVEDATPVDDNCIEAWLIHCEIPGRPRRRGAPPCEPEQADRSQEIAQVTTVPSTKDAPPAAPTSDAVFLGRFGCGNDDATIADYTSIKAASVKDPAGRALMQVGPLSASDRNLFLVSTTASGGTLAPRIALERLGNNRFTGNVTLADYHYGGLLRMTDEKVLSLVAKLPGSLGAALHLRITPSLDNDMKRTLEAQIFSGTNKVGDPLIWKESDDFDPEKDLGRFADTFIRLKALPSLSLSPLFDQARIANANTVERVLSFDAVGSARPKELFDRFPVQQDIQLHPRRGSLLIEDWPNSNATKNGSFRGCDDIPLDDGATSRDPAGLSFLPMAEVPKAPPIPGVYSVRVGDKKNPIEELHLDLGKKRDSDLSTRFALGTHGANDGDPFVPWLEMNGICGVSLPFPVNPNIGKRPTSVHVNGTIERGPIKPDMSDPTFTNLMATAWLTGLQKGVAESTIFDLSFALPTTIVDNNHTLSYDLKVKNSNQPQTTVEGFIETLKFADGNPRTFPQSLKPPKAIPPNVTTPTVVATLSHIPPQLPPGKVRIRVVVYGKNSGAWWWKSHEEDFTITAAPSIDKSGIPDTVPPNTPFDANIGIRNEDDTTKFKIHKVTIDTEENTTQEQDCLPHHTVSYVRHYPNGIPAARDIAIDATTDWDGGPSNPLSDSAHVDVKNDLTASIANVVAPTTSTALKFDLNIDASTRAIKLLTVTQQLTSPDFATTPVKPIAVAQPDIAAGGHLSITGVTGAKLPHASNDVKLVIKIEYERDGLTWRPPKPFVNEEVV